MSGAVYARTPNLGLGLIEFNFPNWGDDANENMEIIDTAMLAIGFSVEGAWKNSTAYSLGDLVVDVDQNTMWRCQVNHTSAATGTFAQDRTAHPTYWLDASQALHARGQWTTATQYYINDVVYEDANKFSWAIATRKYISSPSYDTDVANGDLVIITDTTSFSTIFAPIDNPVFTGNPRAPTPATGDNDTSIATTAYVKANLASYAPLNAPIFTGDARAVTPAVGDSDTSIATTAFVANEFAARYTASDVLAKLLTVDGAGSGLDADLLDGQSSAYFLALANMTGTLTDAQHGNRDGGTLHAVATASVAGFFLDAPSDGVAYTRKNAAWAPSTAFVDAPSDGKTYGRLNATWSEALPISGGNLTGNLSVNGTFSNTGAVTLGGNTTISNGGYLFVNSASVGNSLIYLDKAAGAFQNVIYGRRVSLNRWSVHLGTGTSETGSDAGSDFQITGYADGGGSLGSYFSIARSTGNVTITNNLSLSSGSLTVTSGNITVSAGTIAAAGNIVSTGGSITSAGTVTASQNFVSSTALAVFGTASGSSGTCYIRPNGWNNNAGALTVGTSGNVTVSASLAITGTLTGISNMSQTGTQQNTSATVWIIGAEGTASAGSINLRPRGAADTTNQFWVSAVNGDCTVSTDSNLNLTGNGGWVQAGGGIRSKAGQVGAYSSNYINIEYRSGTGTFLWVNSANQGQFTLSSDYRIKKDVADLDPMWDTLKKLRPRKYTNASWPDFPEMYMDSDDERWGFVAHELQEDLLPTAASGYKDEPNSLQTPFPLVILAVVVRALQEAQTRIEQLEALVVP